MTARSIRTLLLAALAAFALAAMPAVAGANPTLSAVDALSSDVATDSSADSTSASTASSAKDSPSVDTYSGGGEKVPAPVDCDDPKTASSGSGSTATKPTATCGSIIECSSADTDGKDANGKPCVECSAVDTDGVDASGKACVPVTETAKTQAPQTESVTEVCTGSGTDSGSLVGGGTTSGGGNAGTTTVCGGGGTIEEPTELPVEAPAPVAGGGMPEPVAPTVAGGGGPELPFTGLPLWYALYGGLGLVLLGGAFWARGRFGQH